MERSKKGTCSNTTVAAIGTRYHRLMADGAVKFITDSIEAGNSQFPTVYIGVAMINSSSVDPRSVPGMQSPYGLWGRTGHAS